MGGLVFGSERERWHFHGWKVRELFYSYSLSEPCGIPKEHQASEPWCSQLLFIQHFEGHISPCYRTTSISTTDQVQ